jgi:hypothetical protein
MKTENLLTQLSSLPSEAQQQVADFVAFLQTRYSQQQQPSRRKPPTPTAKKSSRQTRSGAALPRKNGKRRQLAREPFIGMWADRDDMHESSDWVRAVREEQWASHD